MPGCFLPPWTPSLAMDVEYTLLFDVPVCQETTKDNRLQGQVINRGRSFHERRI